MKKNFFRHFVSLSLIALSTAFAGEAPILSLAGKWRFALDRQGVGAEQRWFAKDLSDAIQLPGNIESQGYGDEITGQTPWTSWEASKNYWDKETRYAIYRQSGNVKIPFWWQLLLPRYQAVTPADLAAV